MEGKGGFQDDVQHCLYGVGDIPVHKMGFKCTTEQYKGNGKIVKNTQCTPLKGGCNAVIYKFSDAMAEKLNVKTQEIKPWTRGYITF